MRRGANAAGCITRSLASSTVQPLWITDAVLANAYHRFACSHRRHGSNVPGPLEARRRVAKRKNTSWAQLRTPSPIEPALLFGQQDQAEWWQRPEKQENAVQDPTGTPPPSLLDWLLTPEPPRPPSPFFYHSHNGNIPPPPPPPEPKTFEEQSFRARIRHCKHVHEMREALGNLSIDHDQKFAATEVVLAHILTFNSPACEIADFLTEPSFNSPGTDHHLNLLLHLKPNQDRTLRDEEEADRNMVRLRAYFKVPQNWQTLHTALCRAAQLGLIRPVSFQHAMDHLYGYPDASAEESTREALHREAGELLASFKESRLFELRDLSKLWVSVFVDKVLSEPLTAASWKLLLALRTEDEVLSIIKDSRVHPMTTSGLDEAVAFLQSLPESRLSEVRESMQRRPLAPCSAQVLSRLLPELNFVRWIKRAFISRVQKEISVDQDVVVRSLPPRILAHLLASVTEEILAKTWSGECGPEVMYRWGKAISSLDRISFKQWLLDQSNFNLMCSTLSNRLSQQEQFLVGVWILVKLCWSRARATSISEQLSLREAFDQLFPALLRAFNFGPEQLKLFTQSLPFEDTFVKKLSVLLNREHLSELTASVDVGEEKRPTEVAVSSLMDDYLYRQLQASSVNGLSELGESINADLSTFAQISRKLIHGDKYAIRVVKRLLQHNLPIKTSLSQSAQQRMQYRALQEHVSDIATEAPSVDSHVGRPTGHPHLLPSQTLGLMEHLAVAFALAPSLTPRSALVQVHWCYTFLHRYGAPITPVITRALWHAGVTRYQGNGPSYSQMHWILKIVSEVEGRGVAGMLLWNSDFRKRREAILRTVAGEVAVDEEGRKKREKKQQQHNRRIPGRTTGRKE